MSVEDQPTISMWRLGRCPMIDSGTQCIIFPYLFLMLSGWLLGYHLPIDCNRRSWSQVFRGIWIFDVVFQIALLALAFAIHLPMEGFVRIVWATIILRTFVAWLLVRRFDRVPSMTSLSVIVQTLGTRKAEETLWQQAFLGLLFFALTAFFLFIRLARSTPDLQFTTDLSFSFLLLFIINAVVAMYLLRNKHRWDGSK